MQAKQDQRVNDKEKKRVQQSGVYGDTGWTQQSGDHKADKAFRVLRDKLKNAASVVVTLCFLLFRGHAKQIRNICKFCGDSNDKSV